MKRFALILACLALLAAPAISQEINGPPGTYTVTATAPVKVTHGDGWVMFAWGTNPTPPIPPGPGPGPAPPVPPAPDPVPKLTGKLFLSYIVPAATTQDQAALRSGLAAVNWPSLNAAYRSYLDSEPEVATLRLLNGKSPPVLVIQHQSPGSKVTDPAAIVATLDGPASVDAVKAAVAKLRGNP